MEGEVTSQAVALAWKMLYGVDYEEIPDPNKPENIPNTKYQRRKRAETYSRLMTGPGKVLFEGWVKKMRDTTLALICMPRDSLCLCPACLLIRELRMILETTLEAEAALLELKKSEE